MAQKSPEWIVGRFRSLESERRNLDNMMEIISRFVVPGRGRFFQTDYDDENAINWRRREIFDSTAVNAATSLASSIHANLTMPSSKWFSLRFQEDNLNEDQASAAWLQECEMRIWYALQQSNFNLEVSESYLDLVSYGTAVLLHETADDDFQFRAAMTREIYFEEDFDGMPIGIYREKKYTALQVADKWPGTCPDYIKKQAQGSQTAQTPHNVIHAIRLRMENRRADTSKPLKPEARPFEERYILIKDATELTAASSGYYEMPAYVIRWGRAAGSKFGYSPAINVLSDILTLNQLVELIIKSAEKVVDPPTLVQQRGIVGDLDLKPAGLTVLRNIDGLKPYLSGAQFDVSQLQREQLIRTIRQSFYVDQLELKDSPAMTATEVNARMELMQRLLGPALGRIQSDFLDPLINRSFFLLFRAGKLPQPPQQVAESNAEMEVEYLGPLARSQKLHDVMAMDRLEASLGQIAAINPEVLDLINWDKAVQIKADRLGVPMDMLRSEDEVNKIRADRQAQQEQAQQLAAAESITKSMQQGAAADKMQTEAEVIPMAQ